MSQNGKSATPTPPIKKWRIKQGMTQDEAAALLEVHRITYWKLEKFYQAIGRGLAKKVAGVTGQKPGDVLEQYERNARS